VIRLQKALADRGVASRRRAEELITGGRVRVDGEAVMTLGTKVHPDARIDVDGVPTREAVPRYVLLNKPRGIVSSVKDERGRKTVVELIGARERLYPVGRLDTDSEGALLLTNDGDWAERVLHPRYGHEREYDVSVSGDLTPEAIADLRNGIRLEEGLAIAVHIDVTSRSRGESRLRMVLHTGWRRQIRRMLAAVGLKTVRLVRVRIGDLQLGKLRAGEWRELTPTEIADLARPTETPRKLGRRAAARLAAVPRSSRGASAAPATAASAASSPRGTSSVAAQKSNVPPSSAAPRAPAPRGTPPRPRGGVRGVERVSVPRSTQLSRSAPRPTGSPAMSSSSPRRPSTSDPRRAGSTQRPPPRPARGGGAGPARRPTSGQRPGRPSAPLRAPTRRLPSLARPVIRSAPRGARPAPTRAPARGPQRFGRRPPPKYGVTRGPVRAKITPR
jgi:23S rRNA pseudouridine2605 synthase